MSTDITSYVNATLDEKRQYASMLSAAGDLLPRAFLGPVRNEKTGAMEQRIVPGKILMIAETGAMLGIHPMAAIQGIDVIEGNPTIKPSLMSALVRDRGFRLRSWLTGTIEGGDIAAHATLVRPDDPDFTYESTWTPFDAIRAGKVDSYTAGDDGVWRVLARSDKDKPMPWEAFTKRMLRWRVIGDVCSEGAEDVLLGVHYMPDELTHNVSSEGEVIRLPAKPTQDWAVAIANATTKEQLLEIPKRAAAAGDAWPDHLQTALLTRAGTFSRGEAVDAEEPVNAEIVEDEALSEEGDADEIATLRKKLAGDLPPERDEDEVAAAARAAFEAGQGGRS